MKILFPIQYNKYMAFPAEQAGVLLPALSTIVIYEDKNYDRKSFTPTNDDPLQFSFEPDSKFEELPEPFALLQNKAKESENKYLNEWRTHQETKKKVTELEEKIKKMQAAVAEESV